MDVMIVKYCNYFRCKHSLVIKFSLIHELVYPTSVCLPNSEGNTKLLK